MASLLQPETIADLLDRLGVPPQRVRLRPAPGDATEDDAVHTRLCELIDGALVEKPMGWYESRLAAALIYFLERFLDQSPLGIVLDGSGLIRVAPGQLRLPDVAFYSWRHFPGRTLPLGQILDVIPDLAVEIVSPSNTVDELARKRAELFAAGCTCFWQVYPEARAVEVFTSPDDAITVNLDGTLDGGAALPGFSLTVRAWFERAGERK